MALSDFYGSDILMSLEDSCTDIIEIYGISWEMKEDGCYHFYLQPAALDEQLPKERSHITIHHSDRHGGHYGIEIGLYEYVGESQQPFTMLDEIKPPIWEYKGCFTRPWTKMIKVEQKNGTPVWGYPAEKKA